MPAKFKSGGKRVASKTTTRPAAQQVPTPELPISEPSSSGLHPEAEDKFELELCWCIQQLELSMTSNKIGDKQVNQVQKNLKLLKSKNVPLIQKRQIMRATFGDYRAKMHQEEKKHSRLSTSVKISTPQPATNKCVFVRKAQVKLDNSLGETNGEASSPKLSKLFKESPADEPFKFNFTCTEVN